MIIEMLCAWIVVWIQWILLSKHLTQCTKRVHVTRHEEEKGFGNGVWLAECLLSMHKALGWLPAPHKQRMVVHACNPSTQEGRCKKMGVQKQSQLESV